MTAVTSPLTTITSVPSLLPATTADQYEFDHDMNYDYTVDDSFILDKPSPLCINEAGCVILVAINVIIFLLGILGNGVVMWVIGFKMKKMTVTTMWYLSLAISDFIFCATLPFNITLTATRSWLFGRFMCKFTSFILFLNMFSSIFLMVLISVDRCVAVVYAVWAQNNRTLKKAGVAVIVAWVISIVMSIPSLVVRVTSDVTSDVTSNVTSDNKVVIQCYNNFAILPNSYISIPVMRFVLGFVLPLVIITVCYTTIIVRLQNNKMVKSSKPFKVMTALIVTFVISWLPYHVLILLDINPNPIPSKNAFIATGLTISVTLASANSCMNPFLYAFMGQDIKKKLLSSFVSKIEHAFSEDRPSRRTSTSQAF